MIGRGATVHSKAKIARDVFIGPNCTVGKATIGAGTQLIGYVYIFDGVNLGENVRIDYGVVLGGQGFGFVRDEDGTPLRIPQLMSLIVSQGVVIGANSCIDRGSTGATRIGQGSRIGCLCHIAHNVVIKTGVQIGDHVNISGSSVIEERASIMSGVTVRNRVVVGAEARILEGSNVTKDVPHGEIWSGNPARKISTNNNSII